MLMRILDISVGNGKRFMLIGLCINFKPFGISFVMLGYYTDLGACVKAVLAFDNCVGELGIPSGQLYKIQLFSREWNFYKKPKGGE